jgi:Ca2+-binding EF-hand superfamily protein
MNHTLRYALILGSTLVLGGGIAVAQMNHTRPAGPSADAATYQDGYPVRGRAAEKFLTEFDLKKDGRVTHDEFNRTLAHEFAAATGNKPDMTLDQYAGMHAKDLRQEASLLFHGMNWKGDGRLSLEEYMAAERTRFEYLDRDGAGAISCRSSRSRSADGGGARASRSTATDSSTKGLGGARGRTSICYTDDLNKDGQVTRAEFDKANTQQFNQFAKGGAMNQEQFFQMLFAQSRAISERVFRRLDRDDIGKITLQEWAASQERLFARLDKNNDGVVTLDELSSSRRGRVASRN